MQHFEDDVAPSIWDEIESGERAPLDIIYFTKGLERDHLIDLHQWGALTGYWTIHEVKSLKKLVELNQQLRADVIILCNSWVTEAERVAKASPQTPICMTIPGGYDSFDFSPFPPQVISAGWAAPREGEFMDFLAEALSKIATEIIYRANNSRIEIVREVSDELLARLSKFPEDRFKLDPRKFEEVVAELLSRMSYDVRLTPRSGDKGRDVIACLNTPTDTPVLMLVECKRYATNRLVGPEPITRVWFRMFDDHANTAMVVTTSGFQPIARETARDRGYQISLKDGEDFIKWVAKVTNKTS